MMRLHLDFETFCAYLIRYGMYRYVEHESFDLLCMCYAFGNGPVELWVPGDPLHDEVSQYISDGGIVAAHNAGFEYLVWNRYFKPLTGVSLSLSQMVCTAAKAAALALPRALDKCAEVLRLTPKDTEGKRVMMKLSKPRKPTKHNPATRWTPELAPKDFEIIYEYCKTDVIVEREIDQRLPDLTITEQAVWQKDMQINTRGVKVDIPTVKTAINTWERYKQDLVEQCHQKTGVRPSQRQALYDWLYVNTDLNLPNLTAEVLDEALGRPGLPPDLDAILKARRYSSATSIGKYDAMLRSACEDGRLRGMFLYHGAGTGRWAGRIVQLHNLPRGGIADVDVAIDWMAEVPQLYKNPAKAISACIRGMLIADDGMELAVADYSSIEARGVQWLAGDEDALDIFRKGLDPYIDMASHIYNVPYNKVTKSQRAVGKQAILGLGYGMGWKKFQMTCAKYGIIIDSEFAKRVVKLYRSKHIILVKFWKKMETRAMAAILYPGKEFTVGKVSFITEDGFLFMILPSGRRLAYFKPSIRSNKTSWGENKSSVSFWGTNSQTHQWQRQYTYGAKLVENCLCEYILIITTIGVIHLHELKPEHKVWDGMEFVTHGGLINQGEQEVIEWNGIQGTRNHLIWAGGLLWRELTLLDESTVELSLRPEQDLVSWSFWKGAMGSTKNQNLNATVEKSFLSRTGSCVMDRQPATVALVNMAKRNVNLLVRWMRSRWTLGVTGTPVWCPGARCQPQKPIKTMGPEVSQFVKNGLTVEKLFFSMCKHSITGALQALTWIVSTMKRGTTQGTSVLCPGVSMLTIEDGSTLDQKSYNTKGRNTLSPSSGENSVWGGPESPLFGDSTKATPPKKLQKRTVYDIRNCGPRNSFVVLGKHGPVLAHNCTQAVARDILANAMLKYDDIVLHVHDEPVREVPIGSVDINQFAQEICDLPLWADGCPIDAEGFLTKRYKKEV